MKYFIVSDVHGFYDELIKGLEEVGFDSSNPEHIFVSLGDLFDRGDKSYECLQFVNGLTNKILICGNHENCMQDAILRKHFKSYDSHNKTDKTCWEFYKHSHPDEEISDVSETDVLRWLETYDDLNKYFGCLKDYHIIGNNIFVHGWVPYWCRTIADVKRADWVDWYDAVWENGASCWYNYGKIKTDDSEFARVVTVFCGHVHSWFANHKYHHSGVVEFIPETNDVKTELLDNKPFIDDGIVNLDSYTRATHNVNVYILEI